jgi:branched-chain amino acid transport system permease protein
MFEATLFTILAIIVISISTQAYNLVIGYAGMMHLGHIGFYAIGAYTAAILSTQLGTPFLGTLIMSFLIAAIAGFLIGIPTIRLRGDYLTIGTLGFSEVIRLIITNWYSMTGGALGIDKIPECTDCEIVSTETNGRYADEKTCNCCDQKAHDESS